MTQKIFTIRLPGDMFATLEEFAHYAIYQAREEAEDFVIPAAWRAEHVSGDVGDWEIEYRVTRESN